MRRSIVPLALAFAALAPATASAAVRCVDSTAPGCDSSHDTIQEAVGAAADGDTIRIAAGTYVESVGTDEALTFEGAGAGTLESAAGATTIAPATGPGMILSASATIRGLRVEVQGPAPAVMLQPAAAGQSFSLDRVVATGGTALTYSPTGEASSLSIADSELKAFGGEGSAAIGIIGPAVATIARSRLLGGSGTTGVGIRGADARISDTTISGDAAANLADGSYEVVRSRLVGETGGTGLMVQDVDPNGLATLVSVRDSLISAATAASRASFGALQAMSSADSVDVDVVGSTVVGRGPGFSGGIGVTSSMASGSLTVDLRNSVARVEGEGAMGPGSADLSAFGGTITAQSSSFTSTQAVNGGSVPAAGTDGNVSGNPMLDAAFRPLPGSPLIDAGNPAFVEPGELDLAGLPRILDGDSNCSARPDIGAYEVQSPCVRPPGPPTTPLDKTPPALSKVSLLRKAFTARKPVHKGRKRGSAVRFTLSEAARVTLAIERKAAGRRVKLRGKGRCVRPTRKNAKRPRCRRFVKVGTLRMSGTAGRNELKISGKVGRRTLAPGAYRAKLVATDGGGLRSRAKTVAFRVLRP